MVGTSCFARGPRPDGEKPFFTVNRVHDGGGLGAVGEGDVRGVRRNPELRPARPVLHLYGVSKAVEQRGSVVIRFAGDSGDGMQLTGGQFTSETAILGNDLSSFPD